VTGASIDYGQTEIAAFSQAAAAGVIRYDEEVARQAVQKYDDMIAGLQNVRNKLRDQALDPIGFGGFESGKQLTQGFSNKAADGISVLDKLIEGAMLMQVACLRAANLAEEADQRNADALRFAAEAAGNSGQS
jgi:hypothetical protein